MDLTPSDAWETYVGSQTVREFLENGGAPVAYMSTQHPDMPREQRDEIADLLQAYIYANQMDRLNKLI